MEVLGSSDVVVVVSSADSVVDERCDRIRLNLPPWPLTREIRDGAPCLKIVGQNADEALKVDDNSDDINAMEAANLSFIMT